MQFQWLTEYDNEIRKCLPVTATHKLICRWLHTQVKWIETHGNRGCLLNMKMSSFQYRDSHYKDKSPLRLSYHFNGKTFFILWRGPGVNSILEVDLSWGMVKFLHPLFFLWYSQHFIMIMGVLYKSVDHQVIANYYGIVYGWSSTISRNSTKRSKRSTFLYKDWITQMLCGYFTVILNRV